MKTIAYIDGGNLYHGLLRRCPRYKWLDLAALVRSLLSKEHDLVSVKYFTALPNGRTIHRPPAWA